MNGFCKRPMLFVAAATFFLATIQCVHSQEKAEPKIIARVALLSDPHVNRATNGMDATFKAHFEKTIEQVNEEKPDLVLIAGDLTQSGLPEEFADFKEHAKRLKAPVRFVPGNHDVG